jgi:hypothetical protein
VSPLNQSANFNANVNVVLDGNVVGRAAVKFMSKQGGRPQTGISYPDFSQIPAPAGGLR